MRRLATLTAAAAFALAFGFTGTAWAVDVTITNPSFEDDPLIGDGDFSRMAPLTGPGGVQGLIGWTHTNTGTNDNRAGAFDPTASSFTSVPDGSQIAYSNGPTLSQVLGETLAQWTKYTLSVDVGDRKEAGTNIASYKVQLLAGGTVLAEDNNGLSPADDQFLTSTIMFSVFAFDPELGNPLEIRLLSGGTQVNFDDVKLTAVPFTTLFVDDDGTFDNAGQDCAGSDAAHTSVQDAIDAASTDDVIKICPGTYTEDLLISTDGLTLMGIDMSTSIIKGVAKVDDPSPNGVPDGSDGGFPNVSTPSNIQIDADDVTITHLTIQSPPVVDAGSGDGQYTSGITLVGKNITISDNYFFVSTGMPGSVAIQTWDFGVFPTADVSGLAITDNTFASSTIDTGAAGRSYEGVFINGQNPASLDPANPVVISGNHFSGNLHRAVGVTRDHTTVSGNTVCTNLTPEDTADFGRIPWGIKVWGNSFGPESLNVTVSDNTIGKRPCSPGNFNVGISINATATGTSEVAENTVDHADTGIHVIDVADDWPVRNNSIGHSGDDGILIESDDNTVNRNTPHHSGDDGIEVTGEDNSFEGNNSHHNVDCAYEDNGSGNTFSTSRRTRNKAKFNGDDGIPGTTCS